MLADRLPGHAAELGFYFLFALFPTLFSASSLLGLAARSANQIFDRLLDYLGLLVPMSALGTVLKTFNETTAAATPGKVTFGLVAAIWSASIGISAVQDTLNAVYKIDNKQSYLVDRLNAIGLTLVLSGTTLMALAACLSGDLIAALAHAKIYDAGLQNVIVVVARFVGWSVATAILALSYAIIYYWAPSGRMKRWRWLTPGAALGVLGWLLASLGLRIYLHFFNSYSITYGSLGAVIILLTWFYIAGLMLLLGAEINCEIEAAILERHPPIFIPA